MRVTVVEGDITTQDVDAVVNAANSALLGGGGLLGAAIAARMLSASRAPLIVTITFAVSGLGLLLAGLAPVLAVALAGMASGRFWMCSRMTGISHCDA